MPLPSLSGRYMARYFRSRSKGYGSLKRNTNTHISMLGPLLDPIPSHQPLT
jgi:hypothetical protein